MTDIHAFSGSSAASPHSTATDLKTKKLHIMCERDVGLFSLIQQVIANIPWAIHDGRVPIAYFTKRCTYYTPDGYAGRDSVWEYYFEPLVSGHGVETIPANVKERLANDIPAALDGFVILDGDILVTSNFGENPSIRHKALQIPWQLRDPSKGLRAVTAIVIRDYIRPRAYIIEKVESFFEQNLKGHPIIGVHARGTDALSSMARSFRHGSLIIDNFIRRIDILLKKNPTAKVLVATDEEAVLDRLKAAAGDCVVAYDSVRHREGEEPAGLGPTGWLMPAYITADPTVAARNGEEAVIEYLLLNRATHLVHNGASLARTVLLAVPEMPHTNVHPNASLIARLKRSLSTGWLDGRAF